METAVREDPHLEHVRPSDVVAGNSQLVMAGTDGYAATSDPSANEYGEYQSVAGSHPGVISTTAQFTVTVENETADSGATGSSGAGAAGGGQ